MSDDIDCFSASYAEARTRFLAGAAATGLKVVSHAMPLPGADGEELAMDVAWQGPPDADKLFILSSGCHGIEGYAGSGAQVALLQNESIAQAASVAGVAILYVHALNPHGFSWCRRVTGENVDLNRNFVDFSRTLPANPAYERLAPVLLPAEWPPGIANTLQLAAFTLRHGMNALQAAVSSGQYSDPRGLFFGGHAPTWSQVTLRRVLREFASPRSRIGWVDVHTGLGPRGVGERILAARHDDATRARARAWWGDGVTSTEDASSTSAALNGQMWSVIGEECPAAEYTGIALEFGTAPRLQVLQALRGDHWLAQHPDAPPELQQSIKRRLRQAFYVETPQWKRAVLDQTTAAVAGALRGLA